MQDGSVTPPTDAYDCTLISETASNVKYLKLDHERGIDNMN